MPDPNLQTELNKNKRPRGIKLITIFILLIGLFNFTQFLQTLTHWQAISSLPLTVPPLFLAVEGLVWFSAGIILCWGLWTGRSWGRPVGMIISILYCLYNWAIMIWVADPTQLASHWPVDLVFTLLGLGVVSLALNHPLSLIYFK